MEIDEHLRYTFLQFEPAQNNKNENETSLKKRTPDYFLWFYFLLIYLSFIYYLFNYDNKKKIFKKGKKGEINLFESYLSFN